MSEEDKSEALNEKQIIMTNIKTVVLYALSVVVALGLNDIVLNIFNSFHNSQHIVSKVTYIMIMFGFTLLVAYQLSTTFDLTNKV